MKSDLKEIKLQVQKTNGRVAELEHWRHLVELEDARQEGEDKARTALFGNAGKMPQFIYASLGVLAVGATLWDRFAR